MKLLLSITFLLLPLSTTAQFACTLSGAADEDSCLANLDDDSASCVWCSLSQFGFCVAESQAEAMEQALPGVQCDRAPAPSTDDDAAPVPTDDDVAPNDDGLPDNYWECLKQKDAAACSAMTACTWCKAKAGFGLCMTGPSAESAADSDWFDCAAAEEEVVAEEAEDPYDSACVMAYLQDPTKEGCKAAIDQDGNACEWCDLSGMTNLCLTDEQAQMAAALGVTCEEAMTAAKISLRGA
jgi:hypothetical protein